MVEERQPSFQYHYPPTEAELRTRPGYVPNLHRRAPDGKCVVCNDPMPCHGARLQQQDASRFTDPWWLDDARFDALKAEISRGDERDRALAAAKKAAKSAEAATAETSA
jgi:hypothetical protein